MATVLVLTLALASTYFLCVVLLRPSNRSEASSDSSEEEASEEKCLGAAPSDAHVFHGFTHLRTFEAFVDSLRAC